MCLACGLLAWSPVPSCCADAFCQGFAVEDERPRGCLQQGPGTAEAGPAVACVSPVTGGQVKHARPGVHFFFNRVAGLA